MACLCKELIIPLWCRYACCCVQRDNGAGSNDEMTVDVIGVDDHEKENDWDPKLKDIPGWYDKINQWHTAAFAASLLCIARAV